MNLHLPDSITLQYSMFCFLGHHCFEKLGGVRVSSSFEKRLAVHLQGGWSAKSLQLSALQGLQRATLPKVVPHQGRLNPMTECWEHWPQWGPTQMGSISSIAPCWLAEIWLSPHAPQLPPLVILPIILSQVVVLKHSIAPQLHLSTCVWEPQPATPSLCLWFICRALYLQFLDYSPR